MQIRSASTMETIGTRPPGRHGAHRIELPAMHERLALRPKRRQPSEDGESTSSEANRRPPAQGNVASFAAPSQRGTP